MERTEWLSLKLGRRPLPSADQRLTHQHVLPTPTHGGSTEVLKLHACDSPRLRRRDPPSHVGAIQHCIPIRGASGPLPPFCELIESRLAATCGPAPRAHIHRRFYT